MTLYEALKINTPYFEHLARLGYKRGDERHISLYEEYCRMMAEGYKTTYVVAEIADRYGVAERTVYNVVKRFSNGV